MKHEVSERVECVTAVEVAMMMMMMLKVVMAVVVNAVEKEEAHQMAVAEDRYRGEEGREASLKMVAEVAEEVKELEVEVGAQKSLRFGAGVTVVVVVVHLNWEAEEAVR